MTTYRLALPYERPPKSLHGNTRSHWRSRAKDAREVRETVAWLATQARIPKANHLTVWLVWAPGDRRRRDSDNLVAFQKICCDALARGRKDLVGLDLVEDDAPRFMTKLMPKILDPDQCDEVGMWLYVETAGEVAA